MAATSEDFTSHIYNSTKVVDSQVLFEIFFKKILINQQKHLDISFQLCYNWIGTENVLVFSVLNLDTKRGFYFNMGCVYNNTPRESASSKAKHEVSPVKLSLLVGLPSLAIVLTVVCLCYNHFVSIPNKANGFETPEQTVTEFIGAIDGSSDTMISDCLHLDLAGKDIKEATMNISDLTHLEEEYDITFSDVEIGAPVECSSDDAEQGLLNAYGMNLEVVEACMVPASANMSYTIGNLDHTAQVNFDLVCVRIKSGGKALKWTVYTGKSFDEQPVISITYNESIGSISGEVPENANVDTTDDEMPEKPVTKTLKELEFYEAAFDDLTAGKVTIDDAEYTFPVQYSNLSSLFSIRDKVFSDDDSRIIRPNHILQHVVVDFCKKDYSKSKLDVSIGNVTKNNVDVADGVVTTLYIGKPKDGFDYPVIYLPGNVTFGTSYNDILKMYGPLDVCSDSSNIIMHNEAVSFYQVELNNRHNHLYLEFSSDNKLVAVEWYYYDLSGFTPTETEQ